MGAVGLVVLLAMVIVWCKMEGKTPIRFSANTVGIILRGIMGALLLGVGMCFVMVWENMVLGIVIGLVGIVSLLSLIPIKIRLLNYGDIALKPRNKNSG